MRVMKVCTNCGWRKRLRSRAEYDDNRFCPRCSSVTRLDDDAGSWGLYLTAATAAVVLAMMMFACLGLIAVSILVRMR